MRRKAPQADGQECMGVALSKLSKWLEPPPDIKRLLPDKPGAVEELAAKVICNLAKSKASLSLAHVLHEATEGSGEPIYSCSVKAASCKGPLRQALPAGSSPTKTPWFTCAACSAQEAGLHQLVHQPKQPKARPAV
jgi:hypothetical protein